MNVVSGSVCLHEIEFDFARIARYVFMSKVVEIGERKVKMHKWW